MMHLPPNQVWDMSIKEITIAINGFKEYNGNKSEPMDKSDLDKLIKDSDRKTQIEATEYKSELEKYTAELNFFQADLQEKITQYKWYTSQYASFMQQYSAGIGVQYRPQKQQQERRGEE